MRRCANSANITGQGHSSEPAPGLTRRDLRTSFLLCLLCLLVYNANFRLIGACDTYPARYLPFGLWHHHSLLVDPIVTITAHGRHVSAWQYSAPPGSPRALDKVATAYWLVSGKDGHAISIYPVVTPVLLMPVYAPAILYLNIYGWDTWRVDWVARIMEKLSASLIAAASVAILYLALRRRTAARPALLLALVYAFGTTTWMISSQALWQHAMAELLLAGVLLTMTGPPTWRAVIVAGLLCGLIGGNRPPDTLLGVALIVAGLWWAGRRAIVMMASAAVPVALVLVYNLTVAGHTAGGYGLVGDAEFFKQSAAEGFAGLLVSPTRGLFVFSPFLLFLPVFAKRLVRPQSDRVLTIALLISVCLQIAFYSKTDWRQGMMFGPRWLTDALPALIWMLAPIYVGLRRVGKVLFLGLSVVAVAIETVGAFLYDGAREPAIYAVEGENAMRAAWRLENAPFLPELGHARPAMDLSTAVQGHLDKVTTTGDLELSGASGHAMTVEGWALTNASQPSEVMAFLDGAWVAGTHDFFARPDVSKALGTTSASGWRLTIPPRTLPRGEHVLAIFARRQQRGLAYYLGERRFRISGDTTPSARQAAVAIARAQQHPGYWMTSFTKGAIFEDPHLELNTFVNAIMLDVLEPVAQQAALSSQVERARQFLTSQIEEDGLIRYHGVPGVADGMGCTITPDAGVTALVWRIAPGANLDRLRSALRTLGEYQTEEGLYLTWLAPRELHRCIDPGKDANPADIAVQMHIHMLLARQDRAAADALCTALRKTITRDSVWVYHAKTSLIPILRMADLEKSGCPIQLPASRLGTTVPGQDIWIDVAKTLRTIQSGNQPTTEAAVSDLLDTLSRDDFDLVRKSPPLLYHDDMTGSLPRYYWSQELGYALWVRLHYAHVQKLGAAP